jgi:hypothetical protein
MTQDKLEHGKLEFDHGSKKPWPVATAVWPFQQSFSAI